MATINLTADMSSITIILVLSALLAYKASFLHNRKIFRLSILQILYLVIIPGFFTVFLLSYIQSILSRPMVADPLIGDVLLINGILLSALYTYGGVAIHAVTKMLSETSIRHEVSEAGQLNKYFHLNFSHNLFLSACLSTFAGLAMLELNHQPELEPSGLLRLTIKGVLTGLVVVAAMYLYTKSKDQYLGRWADFKATFATVWVLAITLLYGVKQTNPVLRNYDLLLPLLLGLALIATVNVALIFRRIKRLKSFKPPASKANPPSPSSPV